MYSRTEFASALSVALSDRQPRNSVQHLLRTVLIAEPVNAQLDDDAIRRTCERLDLAQDDEDFLSIVRDVQILLEGSLSTDEVDTFMELLVDRKRVLAILRKHMRGTISRTGLLSYISEQLWPPQVRQRVAALTNTELELLIEGLERRDVDKLRTLLLA